MYKRLYYIGIAAYLCTFVLAVVFYKERIILLDTAHSLFHIARSAGFSLYSSRCGAFVTQILPLLAVKTAMPLNTVVWCYSVGFVLYYLCCYLICGLLLKEYRMALVMLLFHILFVSHTFYYIPSELPQGVDFLLLICAFIEKKQGKSWTAAERSAILLASFFAAFFHPLVPLVLGYYVLFYILSNGLTSAKAVLVLFILSFAIGFAVKTIFFSIPYDRHAASGMKNFIRLFPNYLDIYSNRYLLANCCAEYIWMPVSVLIISGFYLVRRNWTKFTFFVVCVAGYVLLVNVSYPDNVTPPFYIENLYLPLGVFFAFPLVYDVLPAYRPIFAHFLFAAIVLTGCVRLYAMHTVYHDRLVWERKFLAANEHQKVIYKANKAINDTLIMNWGTPYEFWLLSTTERGSTASIIIDNAPDKRMWAAGLNKSFVVNWNVFPYSDLPPRYFRFADTTSGYNIIR